MISETYSKGPVKTLRCHRGGIFTVNRAKKRFARKSAFYKRIRLLLSS